MLKSTYEARSLHGARNLGRSLTKLSGKANQAQSMLEMINSFCALSFCHVEQLVPPWGAA